MCSRTTFTIFSLLVSSSVFMQLGLKSFSLSNAFLFTFGFILFTPILFIIYESFRTRNANSPLNTDLI